MSSLTMGDKYPYDADDEWWNSEDAILPSPPPARDWAHRAARGVIADLTDRRGIKNGFDGVDEETRIETVNSLASLIQQAYEESE